MKTTSPRGTLSATVGYDPVLVACLRAPAQHELELLSAAWCWVALVLSAPLAYAGWLLTHNGWLSLGTGGAALLMLMQVVRLSVSGAGLSALASVERVRGYRPGWTPLLWFALLGCMFAQPAQLPLWRREHAALAAAERSKLLDMHERALAALPLEASVSHDGYARELAGNEFLVLRLCALWTNPRRAASYSLLYLVLLLGPLVLAQLQARAALCRYQWLRVHSTRRIVASDSRRAAQRVGAALARYASCVPRAIDPARDHALPLRAAWPVAPADREASS